MDSSDESDYGSSMLQMVDEGDIEFLKNAIQNRSYNSVLKNVKCIGNSEKKKKRNAHTLEEKYAEELGDNTKVSSKILLPIKTKHGIVTRSIKCDEIEEESSEEENADNNHDHNADMYELQTCDSQEPKSSVDVFAKYNESLRSKKVHIGYVCSAILENPEENVKSFNILFKILDESATDAVLSIRKLCVVSMLEVFKDILPTYQIKLQDSTDVKLKKETLQLKKYEESLLQSYKKYLQKLEKYSKVLLLKGNNRKKVPEEEEKLGEVSVQAMCDLLVDHPYFNYSKNIAQTTVPFLNNASPGIREIISNAYMRIFKEDKKEEISFEILKGLNLYLKNHIHNVKPDMLRVLLHLKIKDVNLDQEKDQIKKQKKIESHKQNVLQLSKKERKRKKKLKELEREMLEVKAEENKQNKHKIVTEITKIVFAIFFKILKRSSNNRILGICLEGLAKFAHCISLEYYIDLLNLLNSLLKEEWLTYRDQLHCIQTVFTILSDQGDVINIDPSRFYNSMYKNVLVIHAGKTYSNCEILLQVISDGLIKRRKKITNKRLIGFIKRIATLCLQLMHNGSLSSLAIIKLALQLNKPADVLLDLDLTVGDGDYQPELEDPEYCNAPSTALYELVLLNNHYHPVVARYARHIANGVPATGEGSLPSEFGKCTPGQLFSDFDMSDMAFNPVIPVPKKGLPKRKKRSYPFVDDYTKQYCSKILKMSKRNLFS